MTDIIEQASPEIPVKKPRKKRGRNRVFNEDGTRKKTHIGRPKGTTKPKPKGRTKEDFNFASYEDIKWWIHDNGTILTLAEYWDAHRAGKLPKNFPLTIERVYADQYEGDNIFFNTSPELVCKFEEGLELVRFLGIKSIPQYRKYISEVQDKRSRGRLPRNPKRAWPDKWTSYGSFFGTDSLNPQQRRALMAPYEEALVYMHSIGLRSYEQWQKWSVTERPANIPCHPHIVYEGKFVNWRTWLGYDLVAAATVRETLTLAVLCIYHNPDEYDNVYNFMVFDGGRVQALDICKKNDWRILKMYVHDPLETANVMDVFASNCSSVSDNMLTTFNIHQLTFELRCILNEVKP
jgi:hypothetical protein